MTAEVSPAPVKIRPVPLTSALIAHYQAEDEHGIQR
jgi:hypothetical protein